MLSEQEGWSKAVRTLKWLHSRMRTPATLLLVSNSPPNERIDLLTTVFWHNIGFKVSSLRSQCFPRQSQHAGPLHHATSHRPSSSKVVKSTLVEELTADSPVPYTERLEDYPFLVPKWEAELDIREAAVAAAAKAAASTEDAGGVGVLRGEGDALHGEGRAAVERPVTDGPRLRAELPHGSMAFAPGTAFVYTLEK